MSKMFNYYQKAKNYEFVNETVTYELFVKRMNVNGKCKWSKHEAINVPDLEGFELVKARMEYKNKYVEFKQKAIDMDIVDIFKNRIIKGFTFELALSIKPGENIRNRIDMTPNEKIMMIKNKAKLTVYCLSPKDIEFIKKNPKHFDDDPLLIPFIEKKEYAR